MSHPETSLRERSKAKRRDAIRREGMRLFTERGFDGATIHDIAEAAELAPRTVSMYYPTKLDIALSWSNEVIGRLAATFQDLPNTPFTEVIAVWLEREKQAANPEIATLAVAMFTANPALSAVSTAHLSDILRVAGDSLVEQLQLSADDPLLPMAAAAVGGALTEYVRTTSQVALDTTSQDRFLAYLSTIIEAARGTL